MDLKEHYQKNIVPAMQERFGYKNRMAVPKIVKVVLNAGLSSGNKDPKFFDTIKETFAMISGQQPIPRKARLSISNFKIRKGQTIGVSVTLRGSRMYDFLDKLVKLALPRVRDFRGLSVNAIDDQGNYTIGFREATAFPEVKAGAIERQHGFEITVVTSAKTKEEGLELLRLMGFPFKSDNK